MEKEIVIEVKNIGKKYKINHEMGRYVTLRDILGDIMRKPIRFIKNKTKQIAGFEKKEEFWALRNVSFEVNKGEVIGIIGRNGAGKSTLLKIISQITPPTMGEIKIKGRVSSLLEVGTGFHPELTGRENVFLNGAILGMTKKEMSRKFDQIVEFAGIEKFLDTPVKYYSSGMYVRLAFSVAAHMEPDILIIDEVLSVGDAEFQKKCLDKMEYITQKEGRTILFVSHNLITVQKLCQKTILLENGNLKDMGETKKIIDKYLNDKAEPVHNPNLKDRPEAGNVRFTDIKVSNINGSGFIKSHEKLKIILKYRSDFKENISGVRVVIGIISERSNQRVLRLDSDVTSMSFGSILASNGEILCETGEVNLTEGKYSVEVDFLIQGTGQDYIKKACEFNIETDIENYNYYIKPDNTVCDNLIKYSFEQKLHN